MMLALILCALPLQDLKPAPAPAAPHRPRIGLVLSGGGARGAAHVGVLEVLEEAHVPVDFVVGTSMGAIVGGLYSAGSSPEEIRKTLSSVDWLTLFDDRPAREHLAWRRRQDDRDFLIGLQMGWKDGSLRVPRGVVQGLKIEPLFRNLTMRVQGAPNFDALPLPFRAVAMDLATGERIVLHDGDLAKAMRASMSIAGAFAPVEIDGRELVDGGYVENLPVQLALEMGADIVIAVDVGTPPERDTAKISSLFSVATQVQDVVIQADRERTRKLLRPTDVVIEPALGTITFADFDRTLEAAKIGAEAANARIEALKKLAVSDEEWKQFLARQRVPARPPQAIAHVRLENHSSLADAILLKRIEGLHLEQLDPQVVDRDLARLAGFGVFDRVDFRTEKNDEGTTDLVYSVREKSWGPNYLRFGLGLYDDFHGRGTYSLGVGLTAVPIDENGTELRANVGIGSPLQFGGELWIPLDSGLRWFVAPSANYYRRAYDLDNDKEIRGEVLVETWNMGLDAGRVLGDWGEVRVGVRSGEDGNTMPTLGGGSNKDTERIGALVASFSWDTLDFADFPREGVVGVFDGFANVDALGAEQSFETLHAKASGFTSFGATTVGLGIDAGKSFDDTLPVSKSFFQGGFTRLSGSMPDSQSGDRALLVRALTYHALAGERGMLGMPLFLGASLEAGSTWTVHEHATLSDMLLAGSVFVAADTPLGPAVFALGITEGGDASVALVFGRLY
jgi:NTE family protein